MQCDNNYPVLYLGAIFYVTTTSESAGDCHHHFFKVKFAIFQAIL